MWRANRAAAGDAAGPVELELVLQNAARFSDVRSTALRAWLAALVRAAAPDAASLGVRLCGDRAMRAINRDYRGRDEVTDVLSFPGGRWPTAGGGGGGALDQERHLGDIVVCVPQARRQATARREPLERELQTLLLHGVLHCMGYDHETDHGEMERLERRLRRRWLRAGPRRGERGPAS